MAVEDKKRYNYMENVLQDVNSKFVSLQKSDEKRNNEILHDLLNKFMEKMKEKDPLFRAMYQRIFFGGSYYDGLRVGKPEEFDLDLLLKLPTYAEPALTSGAIPGFVHLQLKNYDGWMRQPEAAVAYRTFSDLLDDQRFLSTQKVLKWMEGVVHRTMNDFSTSGADKLYTNPHGTFKMRVHKGGPALTLKISGPVTMDVDLVTCFVFRSEKWPTNGFKPNPVKSKPEFFIVPKIPKGSSGHKEPLERFWRLSFQEQERVLIDGKRTLKPTIKLLKKMRDVLQHNCIASYYIKTVLLHILEKKDEEFWANSQSFVFVTVLKEYAGYIEKGQIPYYWNHKNNLIGGVKASTLENVCNKLKAVIKDIEQKGSTTNPDVIVKYLCK